MTERYLPIKIAYYLSFQEHGKVPIYYEVQKPVMSTKVVMLHY